MESQIQQIFGLQTPPLPNKNSTFSEHDHVLYQIKWNRECKHIFILTQTGNPCGEVKGHVAYQIKANG